MAAPLVLTGQCGRQSNCPHFGSVRPLLTDVVEKVGVAGIGAVHHGCNAVTALVASIVGTSVMATRERAGKMVLARAFLMVAATVLLLTSPVRAADLTLRFDGQVRVLSQAQLLASPAAIDIAIPQTSVQAKAVPLLDLLDGLPTAHVDTLEIQALDGFVSQIPMDLVRRSAQGGSTALVAVEDPDHPWPRLPNGTASAGPFYLVWQHPDRSGITSEQWPYQVLSVTGVESPVRRWPQIAVAPDTPADAPARRGQDVFIAQCMPCHKMRGGGAAEVGPDLGQPMPAAAYLTEAGLRALIRDPRAVRTWPEQRMVGFDPSILSDVDLDAVVAYLEQMAAQHP
jgi:mono/diheme cytochrome c family protein